MKRYLMILAAAWFMVPATQAGQAISASDMGLSRTDVRDAPAPPPTEYTQSFPGSNERLPVAYVTAPPQIPHNIALFTPVKAGSNACLGCHDKPNMRGIKQKGLPTSIPASHYAEPAYGKPAAGLAPTAGDKLSGSRYVCTQCHVPQANAPTLVDNTF
ncbi:MAG: nitrate reductase cytochrome c-type subunit [Chromatiales bacterium]|nr:nitrate reductase cytochrome c-type subunit [Chromatiales bacterium]